MKRDQVRPSVSLLQPLGHCLQSAPLLVVADEFVAAENPDQAGIAIPAAGYLELRPETATGPIRQNLDPSRFAAATGLAALPAVIEATAAPLPDDGLGRDWPAPDFGIDTHRIYMVQWYAFAIVAAALWLWVNWPRVGRRSVG